MNSEPHSLKGPFEKTQGEEVALVMATIEDGPLLHEATSTGSEKKHDKPNNIISLRLRSYRPNLGTGKFDEILSIIVCWGVCEPRTEEADEMKYYT